MRSRLLAAPTHILVAASIVVVLIGGLVLREFQVSTAKASQTGPCSSHVVIAAESTVPALNMVVAAKRVTIPSGEPAVVATVNGVPITAVALESLVELAHLGHQQTLMQLPANSSVPQNVWSILEESTAQLRHEMLRKLIDEQLYMDDARRLGISVSSSQVESFMQREVAEFAGLAPTDPTHTTFQAYLCLNQLTTATFATNPAVVRQGRQALTISLVNQHIIASLPSSQ
jgi:hypothetical protein